MSYAVIQTGGKQYKVSAGEIIKIEKLAESNPATKVEFNEILAYGDNKRLISKIESVKNKLAKGMPTIPSTLEEELQTNIFLRSKSVKNFSKLRDLKDNF